jgi:SagB-type dehydrogenase family enzyme
MDITNLKSNWELEIESDQKKGVEIPPYQKAPAEGAKRISLPESDFSEHRGSDLVDVILHRRSERKYTDEGLSLAELNWLLFATQGVQQAMNRGSFRPSPSAGARHPFESYIAVFDVAGIEPGLYRYLPYDNELELIEQSDDLRQRAQEALNGQGWNAPVLFFWTAVPYRTHWRYPGRMPKLVALDAGHLCQNLYLACGAIGCGTCGIGAYDQELGDRLLGVDGENELLVYAAPVGKIAR